MSPLWVRRLTVAGGVGGQGHFDVAFVVLGFDAVVAGRLDGDASVAVFDVGVAIDLAQIDVFGVGGDAHLALGFGDAQVVGVEGQVAGQLRPPADR